MKRRAVALCAGVIGVLGPLSFVLSSSAWAAEPEENIGTVSQAIIVGDPVSVDRQRVLGLVRVCTPSGCCSGTLLNRFWVLTADHCVTIDGEVGTPEEPPANMTITASWTPARATPTGYVRYAESHNLDVALIRLTARNLGRADVKLLYHNVVDTSMTMTSFGRGICGFATVSGRSARPARTNCGYLSAIFNPSSADERTIAVLPNARGQIQGGGDSGGPAYVTGAGGALVSIAGVASNCAATFVPGMPQVWMWATNIQDCEITALYLVRSDILRAIGGTPPISVNPDTPFQEADKGPLPERKQPPAGAYTEAPPQVASRQADALAAVHANPRINVPGQGMVRLDWCRVWANECGKPAADAFCREASPDKPYATRFTIEQNVGRTAIISTRQICADPACAGFDRIACSSQP